MHNEHYVLHGQKQNFQDLKHSKELKLLHLVHVKGNQKATLEGTMKCKYKRFSLRPAPQYPQGISSSCHRGYPKTDSSEPSKSGLQIPSLLKCVTVAALLVLLSLCYLQRLTVSREHLWEVLCCFLLSTSCFLLDFAARIETVSHGGQ